MLEPLRQSAKLKIDTSRTHLHQLRTVVQSRIGQGVIGSLSLLLQSFGFKYGAPRDADMVFDVRFLPNPYWESGLRGLSGRDPAVVTVTRKPVPGDDAGHVSAVAHRIGRQGRDDAFARIEACDQPIAEVRMRGDA